MSCQKDEDAALLVVTGDVHVASRHSTTLQGHARTWHMPERDVQTLLMVASIVHIAIRHSTTL